MPRVKLVVDQWFCFVATVVVYKIWRSLIKAMKLIPLRVFNLKLGFPYQEVKTG